jgi:hypothetical protein
VSVYQEYADRWLNAICFHYRDRPLAWPSRPTERTWYVRSARSMSWKKVTGDSTDELSRQILDLWPLRIEYSCAARNDPNTFLDVPFYVQGGRRAANLAALLVQDFSLRTRDILVIDSGRDTATVVACAPPFQDCPAGDVERLLSYFQGTGFREGPSASRMSGRFDEYLRGRLAAWRRTDRVVLAQRLRHETPLAIEAHRAAEFVHENPDPGAVLGAYPELHDYLRAQAMKAVFPEPRPLNQGTREPGRVPLPGSYDAFTDTEVRNVLAVDA